MTKSDILIEVTIQLTKTNIFTEVYTKINILTEVIVLRVLLAI